MDVSDWCVRGAKLVGSLLLFSNVEHTSAKKGLKSSAFRRKSVMIGIYLLLTKLFKMDQ